MEPNYLRKKFVEFRTIHAPILLVIGASLSQIDPPSQFQKKYTASQLVSQLVSQWGENAWKLCCDVFFIYFVRAAPQQIFTNYRVLFWFFFFHFVQWIFFYCIGAASMAVYKNLLCDIVSQVKVIHFFCAPHFDTQLN